MNRFALLISAIVVVAIAWTVGWFYVAGRVEAEIAAFATADGITQPRIVCDDLSVGGFPFQFHPRCVNAAITSGDIAVEIAQLDATALFYRPFHIQLFAESPATVTDSFNGTSQEVSWQSLRGSVRLENDRIGRISLAGSELAYADALLGTTVLATADAMEFHLVEASAAETPAAGDVLDLYLSATNASAPGLDLENGQITLDGRFTGVPPLAALGTPDAARLWQANGGAVTLRALDASADGLALTAAGEAALDAEGWVNGALDVSSQGLVERVSAFVDPAMAELFLGSAGDDGRNSQTITFDQGTVRIGIIPIQTIPPLF